MRYWMSLSLFMIGISAGCRNEPAGEIEDAQPAAGAQTETLSLGYSEEAPAHADVAVPDKTAAPGAEPDAVNLPAGNVDVDDTLAQIQEWIREARFTEAWQAARDVRAAHSEHPRIAELEQALNRLNRLRREATAIGFAMDQMSDPNPAVRDIVHRQLLQGGETARIMLRKALRDTDDPAAALVAAELLQTLGDRDSILDMLVRLDRGAEAGADMRMVEIAADLLAASENPVVLQAASRLLENARDPAFLPLAKGVFAATTAQAPAASGEVAARVKRYLRALAETSEDPDVLAGIARAAAAGGDEALQREFMIPGNAHEAAGEVHAASKSHNKFPARNAFENDDRWLPEQSELPNVFVTYKFTDGHAYMVDRYRIMTQHYNYEGRSPVDLQLQGSHDGATWTVLDTVTGETDWGPDEWREFAVDTPGLYAYYKLVIEKFSGSDSYGYGGIRHIEFHGQWRQPL